MPQPAGQLQAQRIDQRRRFHRVQDVACLCLGYRRGVGQARHYALHHFATERHPHQLPRLHRQPAGDTVGKGFAGRNPVGVDGYIGVIHGAASGAGATQ